MSKAKHNVISYSNVETTRIGFTDLEDNERIPSQKIGYVRYDHPTNGERQFDIQTPEIKMDNYGIPDGDGPYYKTIASRAFVKIPLEVNELVKGESEQDRSKRAAKLLKFRQTLEKLDVYMEENKEKFFGSAKTAKKYSYQPIVRHAQEKDIDSDSDNEDEDKDKDDKEDVITVKRPVYMKAKIPIVWETENITLDIYRSNKEGTSEFTKDGKHTELTDVKTLDELRKHVGYMRDVKYVLHACKIWASKQAVNGQECRKFGITFKVRRIEVQQYVGAANVESDNEDDGELFANSDDENDSEEVVVNKFIASVQQDSESDDSDEDIIQEEEPVIEKKKVTKVKRVTKTK